ncbi:cellulase family glycosylhydrolase [Leptolyngbya sp. FACHB-541]|nr:cellulase family glycosylhydrolase [Leptolyngbya sp. FACHB-541]MBD2000403.1 cellulase family glycosylhydrolase [Leptolyngbya sp. FACHB-541]
MIPPIHRSTPNRSRRWTPLAQQIWLGLLSMVLWMGLSLNFHAPMTVTGATTPIQLPLSTRGAEIVDTRGQAVLLRGVNWFGIETEMQAPHGLWLRDYKEMLAQIRSLGYNTIRLPYSVQSLRADSIAGVDFSIGSNRELEGKTPLEVMDLVIQEAERQGLLILLDSHRLNNQRIPELWYGDGFTEADWIDTWTMLARRYRNQHNVIGADLKNEPYGRASWGTGDRDTDWRLAAERAGNAILEVNPDWLIVVEGVQNNVPGQRLADHWQGGNLEGVKNYPVRLSAPRKLVYSPHEYGAGVFNQPWFSESNFPDNLYTRWETGFHYIATQRIAPILVGEFGGRQVDTESKEGIWQRQFVDYLNDNNLGFTYWSWNPNSDDTGGILQDDWQTVDAPKQELLNQLLEDATSTSGLEPSPDLPSDLPSGDRPSSNSSSSSASPRSFSSNPTSRPAVASASGSLTANSLVQSDWDTGFCVSFRVTNQGNANTANWRLLFEMEDAAITQSWNGSFSPTGSAYEVIPPDWATTIQPDQSVDLGFCANKLGDGYMPRQIRIVERTN